MPGPKWNSIEQIRSCYVVSLPARLLFEISGKPTHKASPSKTTFSFLFSLIIAQNRQNYTVHGSEKNKTVQLEKHDGFSFHGLFSFQDVEILVLLHVKNGTLW